MMVIPCSGSRGLNAPPKIEHALRDRRRGVNTMGKYHSFIPKLPRPTLVLILNVFKDPWE